MCVDMRGWGPLVGRNAVSVFGLLILAGGCTPSLGQQATTRGSDITIGIPLASTGSDVQEEALTRQGYDLWLDWANRGGGIEVKGVRHRVRLLYENDNSNPQQSAQVAQQLIVKDRVRFLLGPYGTLS